MPNKILMKDQFHLDAASTSFRLEKPWHNDPFNLYLYHVQEEFSNS